MRAQVGRPSRLARSTCTKRSTPAWYAPRAEPPASTSPTSLIPRRVARGGPQSSTQEPSTTRMSAWIRRARPRVYFEGLATGRVRGDGSTATRVAACWAESVFRGDSVVVLGRRLDAVDPGAPLGHVQVDLEHPALAPGLVDDQRQRELQGLSQVAPARPEEDVLRRLHGEGRRAAQPLAVLAPALDGVLHLDPVHAGVLAEALVLGGPGPRGERGPGRVSMDTQR